jgi:hypothetical protein
LSIVLSRDVDQPTAPTPSGGGTVETDGEMDASFAIILNLPKCFGSNEAKKLIRELKTKLTGEPPLVIVDLSRNGDGLCGVGRIVGLYARDCQTGWRHSGASDFARSGHSSGTLSYGPPVTEISVDAAANSGFCCCHNRYGSRDVMCSPPAPADRSLGCLHTTNTDQRNLCSCCSAVEELRRHCRQRGGKSLANTRICRSQRPVLQPL